MVSAPAQAEPPGVVGSILALLALVAQAASAVGWGLAMARGFPAGQPMWWANEVAPWAGLLATLAALGLLLARRASAARAALVLFGAAWLALAIAWEALFPASGGRWAPVPLLAGALLVALGWRALRRPRRRLVLALVPAVVAGALLARTQRAPAPDTRPAGGGARVRPGTAEVGTPPPWVDARGGLVLGRAGDTHLEVAPLLAFRSGAPDGGWTSIQRRTPGLTLEGFVADDTTFRGAYGRADDLAQERATLEVRREGGRLAIDAETTLPAPVFSHLNAYTRIGLTTRGAGSIALVFSPAPDVAVDVLESDYPVGRPARFAYVDAGATFRVVEATSAEKGPFRELAAGALGRGAPLSITVLVAGEPTWRITWSDWSAQAGTTLSPTAGWGVPVNALEFHLEAPGAMGLWCTLASTSVGRGFHTVGHAAGTYRNRMRIEPLRP